MAPPEATWTYKTSMNFMAWLKKVSGEGNTDRLSDTMIETIRARIMLENEGIDFSTLHVKHVDSAIRWLAKKEDKMYSDYYQYCYTITCMLRQSPLLVLSAEQTQEIIDRFELFHEGWLKYKDEWRGYFVPYFMVLYFFVRAFSYPKEMLQAIGTPFTNEIIMGEYEILCKKICRDNNWNTDWTFANDETIVPAMDQLCV